jgi:hypothetical protein
MTTRAGSHVSLRLVSFIPVPFPFSSLGSVFHPSPRSERNGTEHERSEASGTEWEGAEWRRKVDSERMTVNGT